MKGTAVIKTLFVFFGILYCLPGYPSSQEGARDPGQGNVRPNIIVILTDDLGWSDLGCYDNDIVATPHLDRLAREGMRFTNAYAAAPICSPSRAALLTGRSPARLHFEFVTKPDGSRPPEGTLLQQPAFPRDLPLEETTLAETIDSSYITGYFGKWHLTQENDRYLGWGEKFGPLQQGFDTGSETRGSHPYTYSAEEKKTFGDFKPGVYPQDALTTAAIDFIKSAGDRPFLLYYSMYYVHTPVRTRCQWLYDKYSALLKDPGRGPVSGRMTPGQPLDKEIERRIHYAAFTETMDAYVGRLLAALKASGLEGNTVVIFTSDNGGHPSFTTSAPLRGSKWNLYEGGIRVPMIVRWPEVISAGSTCDMPVNGMDLFPTVRALTGSERRPSGETDGVSLLPLFKDPSGRKWPQRNLYWHFPFYHPDFVDTRPQSALREGRYKLIWFYETQRAALYDLLEDPGETNDLSRSMPGRTRRMTQELFNELQSVDARLPKAKS